jgi:hypothetical protein
MRFACWISEATAAHSECVRLIGFPQQQFLAKRPQCTRLYVHFLSGMLLISVHVGVFLYDFLCGL